jgi:phenylalanine ammonia-lyase
MNKDEAIRKLKEEAYKPKPDQEFEVRRMQPEDAWGVARCFFAVYGENYPFDIYYIPERLIEENRRKNVYNVVARAENGDIIGCAALYRSSAYSPGVYEMGQFITLPEYRSTFAAFKIFEYILDDLVPREDIDELFGEAVCHHVVSQKLSALFKFRETALEIGLMPAEAYQNNEFPNDRVSTLLLFKDVKEKAYETYVPKQYGEAMEYIFSGLGPSGEKRAIFPSEARIPAGSSTRLLTQFFDFAQVGRFNIHSIGEDLPEALRAAEGQARSRKAQVIQAFVNLGEPWSGEAATLLRQKGYFFGGLLPRWFGTDGMLMQKPTALPNLDSIQLYSERAHRVLELIRKDLESNPACAPLLSCAALGDQPCAPKDTAPGMRNVVLKGSGLTIDDVVAVARYGGCASLSEDPEVLERVESSASFIQWGVKTGEPIYGVNTGFGGMANVAIGEQELCALQNNLIRFLKAGTGEYLSREDVRAAMLLRANSHMRGVSGIRKELISRMLTFLNHGVTPMVRSLGSIGASGDLIPLATITGAITGADKAFEVDFQGERMDCLRAIEKLGLEPFELGPKEGLGMVNGTSVMTGIAANCLYDARRLTGLSFGFQALAFQALRASNQSFHPFIQQVKPHPGQIAAAELMLGLLKGSRMCRNELDGHHDTQGLQPVQDRYSLRCLPQYLGPILDGLRSAASAVEIEMNSASDNPIIDGKKCVSYHSGNFLGEYIGVWMDHTRYYLGLLTKHMDAQIALLVAPEFNGGLPPSLVGNTGRMVNMGLKGLQICGNSIMPLLSFYGNSIADRYPTHAEQFNQNINSQGFNSAVLTGKSVDLLRSYTALAMIFGVQAVELRSFVENRTYDPRKGLSPATLPLYEAVRAALDAPPRESRPLIWNDSEQSLDLYIDALAADIRCEGGVVQAIRPVLAGLP